MRFATEILLNKDNVLVDKITYEFNISKNYCSCKAWLFRNKSVPNMLKTCKHLTQGYISLLKYCQTNKRQEYCTLEMFASWKRREENNYHLIPRRDQEERDARYFLATKYNANLYKNQVDVVLMTMVFGSLKNAESEAYHLVSNKNSTLSTQTDAVLDFLQVSSEKIYDSVSEVNWLSEKFDGVRASSQGSYLFLSSKKSPKSDWNQFKIVDDPLICANLPVLYTRSQGHVVIPSLLGLFLKEVEKFIAFFLLNLSKKGVKETTKEYVSRDNKRVYLRVFVDGEIVCDPFCKKHGDAKQCGTLVGQRKNCFVASVNLSQLQVPENLQFVRLTRSLRSRDLYLSGMSRKEEGNLGTRMKTLQHQLKSISRKHLQELWTDCGAKFLAFDFRLVAVEQNSESGELQPLSNPSLIPTLSFEERKNVLEQAMEYVDSKRFPTTHYIGTAPSRDLLSFINATQSLRCPFYGTVKHYPLLEFYSRLLYEIRKKNEMQGNQLNRFTNHVEEKNAEKQAIKVNLGKLQISKILSESKGNVEFMQCSSCLHHHSTPVGAKRTDERNRKSETQPMEGTMAHVVMANCMKMVSYLGKEGVVFRDGKGLYSGGRGKIGMTWKCKPLVLGFLEFPSDVKISLLYVAKNTTKFSSTTKIKSQVLKKSITQHLEIINKWKPLVSVMSADAFGAENSLDKQNTHKKEAWPKKMGVFVLFRPFQLETSQDMSYPLRVPLSDIPKPSYVVNACPTHLVIHSLLLDKSSFVKQNISVQEMTNFTIEQVSPYLSSSEALHGFFVFFSIWNSMQQIIGVNSANKQTISSWNILQSTVTNMFGYDCQSPERIIYYADGHVLLTE